MDNELSVLISLSRSLPLVRGAGRVAVAFQKFYQRKKRSPLIAPVMDFQMRLNPNELVDSGFLFYPQLYDRREIALLRHELRPGDNFLDVGANIGFYSMVASPLVGPRGRVVAIEADPEILDILKENIALNGLQNVDAVGCGISDRSETLRLGINMNGNRGSSSFLADDQPKGTQVTCVPLSQIVKERGFQHVAAAKVDIEGYGVRALKRFYQDVTKTLFPRLMIVEEEEGLSELMASQGYEELGYWGFNRVYRLKS